MKLLDIGDVPHDLPATAVAPKNWRLVRCSTACVWCGRILKDGTFMQLDSVAGLWGCEDLAKSNMRSIHRVSPRGIQCRHRGLMMRQRPVVPIGRARISHDTMEGRSKSNMPRAIGWCRIQDSGPVIEAINWLSRYMC